MAVLSSEEVEKSLRKKGFVQSNDDHKYFWLIHENRRVLHTKISHGGKHDINDFLIKKMSDQCHLSKAEFKDLINCPLTKEKYFKILEKKEI